MTMRGKNPGGYDRGLRFGQVRRGGRPRVPKYDSRDDESMSDSQDDHRPGLRAFVVARGYIAAKRGIRMDSAGLRTVRGINKTILAI